MFSDLCTDKFCSLCSLKSSQLPTYHWDFYDPASCKDSTHRAGLPTAASSGHLTGGSSSSHDMVPNSPAVLYVY